jgi:thiamine biosynthesis lipoprotein ApbE
MGTSMTIEVSGGDDSARRAAVDEAFAAMAEVDRLMSNYRDDSEVSAVNRGAAAAPIRVSEPLFSVLSAAETIARRSGGAFDITVGPLMKLWGFYQKQPHVPSRAELAAIRPLVDYRRMHLDARARTVRFDRAGMEIDLGGIAKGFAVELAAGVIRRRKLSGFVDAGGNQYFIGTPAGHSTWRVGIEDPDRRGALLGTLALREGAMATSGSYHNFFEVDGRKYGHILDPRTLAPSETSLSVTVVSPDATMADALTKAVFLLGPSAGRALAESFPQTAVLIASRASGHRIALSISPQLQRAFTPEAPSRGR